MATVLEWIRAGGTPVVLTTGQRATYKLLGLDGIGPVDVRPQTIKSPGQAGETAYDATVPPRVVVAQLLVQAVTEAALWDARTSLARAMARQPVRLGETLAPGRLRLTIDGRPSREIEAIPRSSGFDRPRGTAPGTSVADLEWLCPYPYWREVSDLSALFGTDGGFEWALELPLEIGSLNVEREILNEGDVDAPIIARLYGEVDTARIINETTGEEIEVDGEIEATHYAEIDTSFGSARVELVEIATGSRTSILDRVNLAKADFWQLRPGSNTVRFEANINTSGRAQLVWRNRYSGL